MIKKYRSVIIMAFFLLFNLAESLYFGQGTPKGYNSEPVNVWEWLCDIITTVGVFWAFIMGLYDVNSVKRHFVLDLADKEGDICQK